MAGWESEPGLRLAAHMHVIEVGGRIEAWEEALTRLANGNGNGNGAGSKVALGTAQMDVALKREISFSTIIESPSFENDSNEPTQEPVN